MQIEKIVHNDQRRIFTLEEAKSLLPLIHRITESAHKKVEELLNILDASLGNHLLGKQIETEIDQEIAKWQNKMGRLGVIPKGMWLADFDNGSCFYCWKFPENDIRFCHGYQEGFSGRVEIQ